MKNFLFLIAFFSLDVSASCREADLIHLVDVFYHDVATIVGVPKVEDHINIKKVLSNSYVRDIRDAKLLEEISTQLVHSSGEDAWPSTDYFFVMNPEGFGKFKIESIETNLVTVKLTGRDFQGNVISWIDSLSFVKLDESCYIDNVLFNTGQSSRGMLASRADQYRKVVKIYGEKSTLN